MDNLHNYHATSARLEKVRQVANNASDMVTYIEHGNIFNLEGINNYAHGCNCAGAMGKGIALQFREKYPEMYAEYKKRCKEGAFSLGDVFTYDYGKGLVFNLGTQKDWKTKADLPSIDSSLDKMLSFATQNNIFKIALPKIGAGLGSLNWSDVRRVITKVAQAYPNVDLFIVENFREH